MILGLYTFLLGISVVLILIGIFKPNQSGFALIGFGLFFILSLIVLNGNLEYQTGAQVNTSFTQGPDGTIQSSGQTIEYQNESWDTSISHQIGFWMAITGAVGFIWMLFAIKGGKNYEEE